MTALSRHLLPQTATTNDEGSLVIGGVDICDVVNEVGTPAFFYDTAHLKARALEAATAFGYGTAYATKAFLCKKMARLMFDQGLSLDVSTGGEAYTALAAGVPSSRLVMHGNNKSLAELQYALDQGIGRIVVDSFDELERLEMLHERTGQVAQVFLRITPGVDTDTYEEIRTGQEDTKFGFSLASGAASEVATYVQKSSAVHLCGLHFHIGSYIHTLASFVQAIHKVAPFFMSLNLDELVVGGGLGVAYTNDQTMNTITEWAAAVKNAAKEAGIPPSVRITAEPGRAIVATAGITVYRVGTIKDLPGIRRYVSVNGGMSDNMRPITYGAEYEAFLPRDVYAERTMACRIVGKHCESGDVLVNNAILPETTIVGDLVATPVTGAYGYAMASNYNRVPRPPVIFCENGEMTVAVRRETYEDLLRLDA